MGPCPAGMEGCHGNGNRQDNRLENLRWATRKHNHYDAICHGTHSGLHNYGENCANSKLKEHEVRMIIYMWRTGLFLQKEIAKIYEVTSSHISQIVNKIRWKHLWKIR